MAIPAPHSVTLGELAARFSLDIPEAQAGRLINRLDALAAADEQALSFADSAAHKALSDTQAAGVICREQDVGLLPTEVVPIVVDQPRAVFAAIARWLYAPDAADSGIAATAVIDPSAKIGTNVVIGAHSVIGPDSAIGDGAVIGPQCVVSARVSIGVATRLVARVTVLDDVSIGARCVLQPGAVIGADGFGLVHEGDHWSRMPQLGRVIIEDDVDIGANTTVDRGALDDTVIEQGAKLDNLIQIAHNVRIGAHSAIAGCAGLAGSSVVGRHCSLGGGVGLAGHLTLADHVHITGMSMVTRSIHKPGVYSAGTPLDENKNWHKNAARFKKLDHLFRRVRSLEQQMDAGPDKEEDS